jgi:hypothetical protein
MDIEQIRVRIMSEAYDLADRGDHEGYNAIKVMCSDVLELIGKQWVGLTDDDVFELADTNLYDGGKNYGVLAFAKAIEQALKEKNHG